MKPALGTAFVLVLAGTAGCKAKGDAKPVSLSGASVSSGSASAVVLPKGVTIDPTAKVAVPPLAHLIGTATFELGGVARTLELCRLDAAAPPIVSAEAASATAQLAAAPDGTVWVLDHEGKLRHYVNRAARGCELVLDRAFATGGILDVKTAHPRLTFSAVRADAKGVVYLTGDVTKKIVDGKVADHCSSSYLKTDPTTKLAVLDRTTVSTDGTCAGTTASFEKAFDPKAPGWSSPRVIGFYGDELVVRGVDMDGKKEIGKVGIHAPDGKQRMKLGDREGAGAVYSPDAATKCGDDLCVFSGSMQDVAITRFTRDGKLGDKVQLRIDGLGDHAVVAGSNGDFWVHGAATGTADAGKRGTSHAGVILLSRGRPLSPAAASAADARVPRGDEPAHETIAGAIRGVHRGRPFLGSTVELVYRSGSWRLAVRNARGSELSTALQVPPKAAAVSIARSAGPRANANAFLTSSENGGSSSDQIGSAAHWISIERWDVVPYDAKKGSGQEAGYASGRVWIDMDETSRVVGEFDHAVVRYSDDPSQAKKD